VSESDREASMMRTPATTGGGGGLLRHTGKKYILLDDTQTADEM